MYCTVETVKAGSQYDAGTVASLALNSSGMHIKTINASASVPHPVSHE